MGIIHRLAPSEAQKIAAGQVVERPACVMKELVENSLDAGATTISIYINAGGHNLIRVVDNGCGMDADDALACFDNHATSKIKTFDQVTGVTTFGFRGEALASICAVSKITLRTVPKDKQLGMHVECADGRVQTTSAHSGPQGTDMSVADLFYNVPARRKFLKQEETEWRTIVTLFQAFCLSHQSIHFQLFHNDQLVHNVPATSSLKNRGVQLLDERAHTHLVSLEQTSSAGSLTGIISTHQVSRYNKNQIFFFVNNRWIKNYQLTNALLKGYHNVLPTDRYPVGALFLIIDSLQVDINVDPRKQEVRFVHPRMIETLISSSTSAALQNSSPSGNRDTSHVVANTFNQKSFANEQTAALAKESAPLALNSSWLELYEAEHKQHTPASLFASSPLLINKSAQQTPHKTQETISIHQQEKVLAPDDHQYDVQFIGVFCATYLMFETADGMVIIDQHAAHERVLFNQFAARFGNAESINLLFPTIVKITSEVTFTMMQSLLASNGIFLELIGPGQARVLSVPVHLKQINLQELVDYTASLVAEHGQAVSEDLYKKINHALQAQMACKAAIKAGDQLSKHQAEQLWRDVHATHDNFSCPHGRPTRWVVTRSDLEKKFKRRL